MLRTMLAVAAVCGAGACGNDDVPRSMQPDPSDTGPGSGDAGPEADTGDLGRDPRTLDVDSGPDVEPDMPPPCHQGTGEGCAYVTALSVPANSVETLEGLSVTSVGGREISALLRFSPDALQPLPVVIWSHGGSYDANGHLAGTRWSVRLAMAGYAVIHVAHAAPTREQLRQICDLVGIDDPDECVDLSLTGGEDPDGNPFTSSGVARPGDVLAVLDTLPQLAARLSERSGVMLDVDSVAVAGWSAGSQAPLQLAGARRSLSATLSDFAVSDPRPDAFLAISPQGPGYSGFYADEAQSSWDEVRGPTLVMTGDGDEKEANDLTGPVRRQAFENMAAGDKYLFYSTSTDPDIAHGTYNLGVDSPNDGIERLQAGLVSAALAFLDAHLRDRPEAQLWLGGQDAVGVTQGNAEWLSK